MTENFDNVNPLTLIIVLSSKTLIQVYDIVNLPNTDFIVSVAMDLSKIPWLLIIWYKCTIHLTLLTIFEFNKFDPSTVNQSQNRYHCVLRNCINLTKLNTLATWKYMNNQGFMKSNLA